MAFGTPRGWGNGAFATSIWHPARCCFWGVAHGRTTVPTRSNPKKHRLWQFPVLKCPQHLLENWPQAVQSSQNFYITSFSKSSIDSSKKYLKIQKHHDSYYLVSWCFMIFTRPKTSGNTWTLPSIDGVADAGAGAMWIISAAGAPWGFSERIARRVRSSSNSPTWSKTGSLSCKNQGSMLSSKGGGVENQQKPWDFSISDKHEFDLGFRHLWLKKKVQQLECDKSE